MIVHILYASLSIITIHLVGKIITAIFSIKAEKNYFQLFLEQIIGTTSIVTFYSICKTNG